MLRRAQARMEASRLTRGGGAPGPAGPSRKVAGLGGMVPTPGRSGPPERLLQPLQRQLPGEGLGQGGRTVATTAEAKRLEAERKRRAIVADLQRQPRPKPPTRLQDVQPRRRGGAAGAGAGAGPWKGKPMPLLPYASREPGMARELRPGAATGARPGKRDATTGGSTGAGGGRSMGPKVVAGRGQKRAQDRASRGPLAAKVQGPRLRPEKKRREATATAARPARPAKRGVSRVSRTVAGLGEKLKVGSRRDRVTALRDCVLSKPFHVESLEAVIGTLGRARMGHELLLECGRVLLRNAFYFAAIRVVHADANLLDVVLEEVREALLADHAEVPWEWNRTDRELFIMQFQDLVIVQQYAAVRNELASLAEHGSQALAGVDTEVLLKVVGDFMEQLKPEKIAREQQALLEAVPGLIKESMDFARLEAEYKAASVIQAHVRGAQVRLKTNKVKEQKRMENAAAVKLQARVRIILAKAMLRKRRELKKQTAAAVKIQARVRGKAVRKDFQYRKQYASMEKDAGAAATMIQKRVRGMQARKRVYMMREGEKREAAAIKIQSKVRQRQAKKRVEQMRVLKEQEAAAVKIQARVRGKLSRKNTMARREREKREAAAIKIQAQARGYLARRKVDRMKDLKHAQEELERRTEAAIKIQAAARGREARKRCAKLEEELYIFMSHGFDSEGNEKHTKVRKTDEMENAATKIQSKVRGYMKKKEYDAIVKQRNEAAIQIQKAARGYLARQHVAHMKLELAKMKELEANIDLQTELAEQQLALLTLEDLEKKEQETTLTDRERKRYERLKKAREDAELAKRIMADSPEKAADAAAADAAAAEASRKELEEAKKAAETAMAAGQPKAPEDPPMPVSAPELEVARKEAEAKQALEEELASAAREAAAPVAAPAPAPVEVEDGTEEAREAARREAKLAAELELGIVTGVAQGMPEDTRAVLSVEQQVEIQQAVKADRAELAEQEAEHESSFKAAQQLLQEDPSQTSLGGASVESVDEAAEELLLAEAEKEREEVERVRLELEAEKERMRVLLEKKKAKLARAKEKKARKSLMNTPAAQAPPRGAAGAMPTVAEKLASEELQLSSALREEEFKIQRQLEAERKTFEDERQKMQAEVQGMLTAVAAAPTAGGEVPDNSAIREMRQALEIEKQAAAQVLEAERAAMKESMQREREAMEARFKEEQEKLTAGPGAAVESPPKDEDTRIAEQLRQVQEQLRQQQAQMQAQMEAMKMQQMQMSAGSSMAYAPAMQTPQPAPVYTAPAGYAQPAMQPAAAAAASMGPQLPVGAAGNVAPDDMPTEEEIVEYAVYLGMDPVEDKDLLYIAQWALTAPLPEGWSKHVDQEGNEFYFNQMTNVSTYEHPLDEQYRTYYRKLKAGGGA